MCVNICVLLRIIFDVHYMCLPTMFKENATNLNNISVDKGIEWLESFDTILSDCDGKNKIRDISNIF